MITLVTFADYTPHQSQSSVFINVKYVKYKFHQQSSAISLISFTFFILNSGANSTGGFYFYQSNIWTRYLCFNLSTTFGYFFSNTVQTLLQPRTILKWSRVLTISQNVTHTLIEPHILSHLLCKGGFVAVKRQRAFLLKGEKGRRGGGYTGNAMWLAWPDMSLKLEGVSTFDPRLQN